MKTFSLKKENIDKKWLLIDAQNLVLGRVASIIAYYLRGKHKPTYTPHVDCGDNIVVVNADKIAMTGRKFDQKHGKKYYKHTGYLGGIKETTAARILRGRFPENILKKAVERMLGKNKMGMKHLTNLFVYAGENHKHVAQKPEKLDIAQFNSKNTRA